MVVGIILGAVAVVVGLYFVMAYNGFVVMRNSIDRAKSNIDVMLKQRYDEIGKLVKVVKGYAKHEKKVFKDIAKLRSRFSKAGSTQEKLRVDAEMTPQLLNLFAVAENYPKLKANENFMHLQGRVTSLENEIADRREEYNSTVFEFNNKAQSIPSALVASAMGLKPREMFRASGEEKKDVEIAF
jgi:LemA protein